MVTDIWSLLDGVVAAVILATIAILCFVYSSREKKRRSEQDIALIRTVQGGYVDKFEKNEKDIQGLKYDVTCLENVAVELESKLADLMEEK